MLLNSVSRGYIANSVIACASSTPISIASTCAGVDVSSTVKLMNGNDWARGGDGRGLDDQQAFVVSGVTRSGDVYTATVAHGGGISTDFTPTSGNIPGFRFYNSSTGAVIPLVSAVRGSATTVTITAVTGTGAASRWHYDPAPINVPGAEIFSAGVAFSQANAIRHNGTATGNLRRSSGTST
jgi:hypothetical protein